MKISYLGPKGTFSYEICKEYCKNDYEMIEAKTIIDAIDLLENNIVDRAIVPIENSIQGGVSDTIDTLVKYEDIFVLQELILDIVQNLMSNDNLTIQEIDRIYSHSQAISQCRDYLKTRNLYEKVVAVESTARAAQIVCESKEKLACIGSATCATEYNLQMIDKSIEDNNSNKTRFWVLSKDNRRASKDNNHQKMSMIFSVQNKPGALYDVLKIFNEYGLNLTKIESRPAKTRLGEYFFLIDVDVKPNYLEAIKDIKNKEVFFRILGIY